MATLPYVTAVGSVEKALKALKSASTPDAVTQDFVKTVLGIKGGSGNQITSYLKKIGFAAADGKPTDIYTKFRNPATSGSAALAALKHGYAPLYKRNEYMHQITDNDLKGLIIEETGAAEASSTPALILGSIKALRKFANVDTTDTGTKTSPKPSVDIVAREAFTPPPLPVNGDVGMNLSYTINLNLPATSDIAVFNAIFKSLRENLLRNDRE